MKPQFLTSQAATERSVHLESRFATADLCKAFQERLCPLKILNPQRRCRHQRLQALLVFCRRLERVDSVTSAAARCLPFISVGFARLFLLLFLCELDTITGGLRRCVLRLFLLFSLLFLLFLLALPAVRRGLRGMLRRRGHKRFGRMSFFDFAFFELILRVMRGRKGSADERCKVGRSSELSGLPVDWLFWRTGCRPLAERKRVFLTGGIKVLPPSLRPQRGVVESFRRD